MTAKEITFANYYLATLNATEAARRTGYNGRTARQQDFENLIKPYIKEYLQYRAKPHLKSLEVTQERMVKELATIAFSNIGDFFNPNWSLKNLEEVSKEKTGAIKIVQKQDNGVGLQLHDKLAALEKLWELTKDKEYL